MAIDKVPKRPIDKRRESAGSMEVGLSEEGSITDMYTFGVERLLLIKDRAAYEFRFADKIDPERTNEGIPNVQQRLLQAGSDNELVRQVLLTSSTLFDQSYLPELDCGALKECALDAVRELLAMERIFARVSAEEASLLANVRGQKLANGFIVPSLSDLDQELKNFLQRADHFTKELFKILRVFEPGFRNLDKLLIRAKAEKPPNEQFIAFLDRSVPFLKFVREARNAVEHRTPQKRVETRDFELDKDAKLIPPTVEVIHPKHGEPRMSMVQFMREMIRSLAAAYPEAIANVVARKASMGGFEVAVMRVPESRRPHLKGEYMYAVQLNGEWQPLG